MKRIKTRHKLIILFIICVSIYAFHQRLLTAAGNFLVRQHEISHADAAVVLNTGLNLYARLIEASNLYHEGVVDKIVINGDRKNEVLRTLEAQGYRPLHPWYTEHINILSFLGVAKDDVIIISAQDAYDTSSEAAIVGRQLIEMGISSVLVTTSKFHTRRAGHIWNTAYTRELDVYTAAARDDPFDPAGWWKSGRQLRWVMAEYGAWLFYYWKKLRTN